MRGVLTFSMTKTERNVRIVLYWIGMAALIVVVTPYNLIFGIIAIVAYAFIMGAFKIYGYPFSYKKEMEDDDSA